jgi:exonuclease III
MALKEEEDSNILDSPRNKRLKLSGDNEDTPMHLPRVAKPSENHQHAPETPLFTDRHPHTFVTWNCNGFTSRTKWNAKELKKLLEETKHPDMMCLQEVRLKASGPDHQRGRPMDSEYIGSVKTATTEIFKEYTPFWSLADTKYSGTLTLIHQRCMENPRLQLSADPSEKSNFAAFTPQSAIDLILRRFRTDRKACGLAEATAGNKSPERKNKKAAKQLSMTNFFSLKTSSNESTATAPVRLTLPSHHPQGRFQYFFFPDMDIIQTYVPNNGTKDESFQKRQQWDQDMMQFLQERKQILKALCHSEQRKLLWLGDMNVAREYRDGTHWQRRSNNDAIYEWWRDESKCFVPGGNKDPTCHKKPENVGIPGFTTAERNRFSDLLREGDFCDVWRELHPHGVQARPNEKSVWDRANYTWRGHLSREGGGFAAKYQGKGQRLDYFLLSPSTLVTGGDLVKSCDILGYGELKEGLFCGSDHCAVRLELVTPARQ